LEGDALGVLPRVGREVQDAGRSRVDLGDAGRDLPRVLAGSGSHCDDGPGQFPLPLNGLADGRGHLMQLFRSPFKDIEGIDEE
jgi:hypothetical protein